MNINFRLFFTFILPLLFTTLLIAGEWKEVRNEQGIRVYTRSFEGSDMDEFRGVGVINAGIDVIGEVLRDIPALTQWMPDLKYAKIVSMKNRNNLIIYNVIHGPGPVSDRDVFVESKASADYDKGVVTITMRAVMKNSRGLRSGCERVAFLNGMYILKYLDRGKTQVTYQVKSDPGGWIPASIANMTSKEFPYKTLLGLRKMVTKNTYIERAKNSEDRKELDKFMNSRKKK